MRRWREEGAQEEAGEGGSLWPQRGPAPGEAPGVGGSETKARRACCL